MTDHIFLRFIGRDGSMGLRKGKVYQVSIRTFNGFIWVYWGDQACPYSSFKKLLENWKENK